MSVASSLAVDRATTGRGGKSAGSGAICILCRTGSNPTLREFLPVSPHSSPDNRLVKITLFARSVQAAEAEMAKIHIKRRAWRTRGKLPAPNAALIELDHLPPDMARRRLLDTAQ